MFCTHHHTCESFIFHVLYLRENKKKEVEKVKEREAEEEKEKAVTVDRGADRDKFGCGKDGQREGVPETVVDKGRPTNR